ncbi:hypothetical protein BTM36_25565 [Herbaspirillum sp. VT-16-41]|nr:hypothetical protein BTM36_25565 [Herbaspirillum sp. VT-16-41]
MQREWRVEQHYSNDRLSYQMCSRVNPSANRITDDFGNAFNPGYIGSQQRSVYANQTNNQAEGL